MLETTIEERKPIPEDKWQIRPGDKHNYLTMVTPPYWVKPLRGGARQQAIFRCDCGQERELLCRDVRSGWSKCCGWDCEISHNFLKDGVKKCARCQEVKSGDDFNKHKGFRDGLHHICKRCKQNEDMLQRYGIDLDEYDRILKSQNGVCGICGGGLIRGRKRFDIDHDHKTGEVRGLLCSDCNRGIGFLRDDTVVLQRAADYLSNRRSCIERGKGVHHDRRRDSGT